MTLATTTVTAAELAAFNGDKPMLIGNNMLELLNSFNTAPVWVAGADTWSSYTDRTNALLPTTRAFDRTSIAPTAPVFVASNSSYSMLFVFNNAGPADGLHSFDTITILSHNLASVGTATATLQVLLADAPDFTSPTVAISATSITSNKRIFMANLAGAHARYTGFTYARIDILIGGGTGTFTQVPYFGEVIFGRRRQMSYFPDVPFEDKGSASDVVDHHAWSGTVRRYVKNYGRRDLDWTLRSAAADPNGLTQETETRAWWRECTFGTQPSVVVLTPSSSPTPLYMMPDPDLSMPIYGPYERAWKMHFQEQPTFWQVEQAALGTYPI